MPQEGQRLPRQRSRQVFCNLCPVDLHSTPERVRFHLGEQLDELDRHPKVTGAAADDSRVTASKASLASGAPAPGGRCNFVARQPILTSDEKVFGYELFFRDGVEDYFRAADADLASRHTLDTSLQIGLEVLCDGR